jgi:hypothetical protein
MMTISFVGWEGKSSAREIGRGPLEREESGDTERDSSERKTGTQIESGQAPSYPLPPACRRQ